MNTKQRKQIVENTYEFLDTYTFEGPVEDLITRIRGWQEKHGQELYLEINHYSSAYDDCDFDVKLMLTRDETDAEYKLRMEQHAKHKVSAAKAAATRKIKREANERKKLRELAKKYPEELNA